MVYTPYLTKLKTFLVKASKKFGRRGFVGAVLFLIYRYVLSGRKPTLYYLKSKRNKAIVSRIKGLEYYRPSPLVRNGHLMTAWMGTELGLVDLLGFPPFPEIKNLSREFLRCEGNHEGPYPGIITLHWGFTSLKKRKGTVILVPGLGNDVSSPYLRRFFNYLLEDGFDGVIYEPRGSPSNLPFLTTPQTYGSGYTGDIRAAVTHVCKKTRATFGVDHAVFAVGWSLGSAYLVRYTGEEGKRCPLNGIAALGCPVDLASSSRRLSEALYGLYQFTISNGLMRKLTSPSLERSQQLLRDYGYPVDQVLSNMSPFAIDSLITARMYGWDNVGQYYRRTSPGIYFSEIRTPSLLVNARDDTVVDTKAFFIGDFLSNENIIGVKTEHGGHSLSWYEGWLWPTSSWINTVVKDYFNALLEFADEPLSAEEWTKGLEFSPQFRGLSGRVRPTTSFSKL